MEVVAFKHEGKCDDNPLTRAHTLTHLGIFMIESQMAPANGEFLLVGYSGRMKSWRWKTANKAMERDT